MAFYHRCRERILEELAIVEADIARIEAKLSAAEARMRCVGACDTDPDAPAIVVTSESESV